MVVGSLRCSFGLCVEACQEGYVGIPIFTTSALHHGSGQRLETFQEKDAEFFFGRAALTQWLGERLRERRFLAVIGPSGSGKSSVVRAGLLPALRQGALPGAATGRS